MSDVYVPEVLQNLSPESAAAKLLRSYYQTTTKSGLPYFSGARFNALGIDSLGDNKTDEITAEDVAAVLCLGVNLEGRAVVDLLENRRDKIGILLQKLPCDTNLWDESQATIEKKGSDANNIWKLLRSIKGIGPVKASKLMARKRPQLIPIYDRWIDEALNLGGSSKGYWTKYRDLMLTEINEEPLHITLQNLIIESELDVSITPLRACDVILWYWKNPRQQAVREEVLS